MRRHTPTLALGICAGVVASAACAVPSRDSADTPPIDCIELRAENFVEEARRPQAALRVEVEVLDDDCGQTVHMVLWQTTDGAVGAMGLLADHLAVPTSVLELQSEHPDWSESAVCEAVPMREVGISPSEVPRLLELADGVRELLVNPVLEPILIIHGLQYEIRIESGISESAFFFHAPGHPRPPPEALHPLDRWSQDLRESLGLECQEDFGDPQAAPEPARK